MRKMFFILPGVAIIIFLIITIISFFSSKPGLQQLSEANKTFIPDNTNKNNQNNTDNTNDDRSIVNPPPAKSSRPSQELSELNKAFGLPFDADIKIKKEDKGYLLVTGILSGQEYKGIAMEYSGSYLKIYWGKATPLCSLMATYKVPKDVYEECAGDTRRMY